MSDVKVVRGTDGARALAGFLNGGARRKPVVVVSVPAAADKPYIDPDAIYDEVGDLADVYLIRTGEDTFAFSDSMPSMTQVYGGAGRVYPVGTGWATNPFQSPLRFAFDASQGAAATRDLTSDALRMAGDAGLTSPRHQRSLPRLTGEVRGFPTPDRALVRLPSGFATIVQELTLPDVPLTRILTAGMQVNGLYDASTGRLNIGRELLPAEQVLRDYSPGDVVLAQVERVRADNAQLLLHPSVRVTVRRADVSSNELDDLPSLMTPGEVLSARVVETVPHWRLSLIDLEDDEVPRAAGALLLGGPPWLALEDELDLRPAEAEVETAVPVPPPQASPPAEAPAVPETESPQPAAEQPPAPTAPRLTPAIFARKEASAPVPPKPSTALQSTSLALDGAKAALAAAQTDRDRLAAEVRALKDERALAASRVDSLHRQLEHAEHQLQRLRASRRKAARRHSRDAEPTERGPWFNDAERQFRFEVQLAWARRIPAAEKDARPLAAFDLGPDFLPSLDAIDGISRDKVVDVVVEVVTGLAVDLAGRDLHRLRVSDHGGSPSLVRGSDGATCWRVSLQQNRPQARRLHYWQRPGGGIELSRVALHDDFTP